MAGFTTGSLVGLLEPISTESISSNSNYNQQQGQNSSKFLAKLGLAPSVTLLNAFSLLSSALLSVSFLVFLNAITPFVLSTLFEVKAKKIGGIIGSLILADELWSLVLVFAWGSLIDVGGVRLVNVSGHLIVAVAFVLYSNAGSPAPVLLFGVPFLLLFSRLVFATGASALTCCLTAAFSSLAAEPLKSTAPTPISLPSTPINEQTSLLSSSESTTTKNEINPNHSARFAGLLGFATGCGALLSVFVFLRLPPRIASWIPSEDPVEDLKKGLKFTFYVVALLALLEGLFLIVGLRRRKELVVLVDGVPIEKLSLSDRCREVVKDLPVGFLIAMKESEVSLAYLSGFATRAQALVVSAFIPVLVNAFFIDSGLCDALNEPSFKLALTSDHSCRQAFIFSSTLTGIIQLSSLLFSPVLGLVTSKYSQPLILGFTSLAGGISFLGFAFLPDPRAWPVWFFALGMGISQIGGIVVCLSLVARVRGEVVAKEGRELGGSIAGTFSACGGLGVLIIGKASGVLFESWSGYPFLLVGIVDLLAAGLAFGIYRNKQAGAISI